MAEPRSLNPFHALQANRNFRLFWLGQTTSLIGTWMQTVAQSWLALELTNSAFLVGVVSAASSFPILMLSLYGGVIADRYNKLRIVTVCQTLLLLEAGLIWWFTWSGRITIHSLLLLVTMSGIVSAFEIPARQSLLAPDVNPMLGLRSLPDGRVVVATTTGLRIVDAATGKAQDLSIGTVPCVDRTGGAATKAYPIGAVPPPSPPSTVAPLCAITARVFTVDAAGNIFAVLSNTLTVAQVAH